MSTNETSHERLLDTTNARPSLVLQELARASEIPKTLELLAHVTSLLEVDGLRQNEKLVSDAKAFLKIVTVATDVLDTKRYTKADLVKALEKIARVVAIDTYDL